MPELPEGQVVHGDCLEVMATWPAESVDAIVCDPPYGLEFMGKEWDAFRLDDPGTMRHRGDYLGAGQGTVKAENTSLPAAGRVEYGAGKRPTTSRCSGCGKRDQFRNPHTCDAGLQEAAALADPLGILGADRDPRRVDVQRAGAVGQDVDRGWKQPEPGVSLRGSTDGSLNRIQEDAEADPNGRWPANIALTEPIFDGGTPGVVGGGDSAAGSTPPKTSPNGVYSPMGGYEAPEVETYDAGAYSRFFLVPKASRSDREPLIVPDGTDGRANTHPTVKPIELMRHLVRLVTPHGGVVVDPFLGSGSTAVAAEQEGFRWIGIERDAESVGIARARLVGNPRGLGLDVPAPERRRSRSVGHWPARRDAAAGALDFGFTGQDGLPERTA